MLFGATSLSRNGQVAQRPDRQGLSAVKMSAQYFYLPDLSLPHLSYLSQSQYLPVAYSLVFLSRLDAEICGKYSTYRIVITGWARAWILNRFSLHVQ